MMSRMSICLAVVLVFGAGTAHADMFTPVNKTGSLAYTPICAKTPTAATGLGASTKMQLAFTCRCCGWQNWGGHNVCVHQCCT